jgi:hypothetical protein
VSINNLESMFAKTDAIDLDEGMLAYDRYHMVMQAIAEKYKYPVDIVTAVFCALSPNSDYWGNLRSTVSVLQGVQEGREASEITVSTYGHCKLRAISYAKREAEFLAVVKGLKITSFYHNITNPTDNRWVTVDGHMTCIWAGVNLTMKNALVITRDHYDDIHDDIIRVAFKHFMRPNQMQAVLWFCRKRISNVVYDPQLQLFGNRNDVWGTYRDVETIKPYPKQNGTQYDGNAGTPCRPPEDCIPHPCLPL